MIENFQIFANQFLNGIANRYRIIGLLGKGGMGEVYKAEDLELNQMVALKFLPESFAKNKDALARFRGEVRNARQVSHPSVCRVFDIGEIKGAYYLSMEYVDGDDLSMLLRRIGRLPSDKAVEISRQICLGLHAIHDAGILHRDLKPANIIIDSRGKARITDFGIAGIEQDLKGKKEIVGTPVYMSPEQITGGEVTTKSDIYSLGLLLYEIFTGKQTFQADSINELINIHQSVTPTNPSKFLESIDPLVEKVINRCLEKNPDDRPKSALQVALSLPGGNPLEAAIAAGETPSPEMIAAAPKKGALKPKVALLLSLLIIAGFILLTVFYQYRATYNITPLDKSPEVLAERAETIVRDLGYTETPAEAKYKFQADYSYKNYAEENKFITNARERLRAGQPFFIYFIYRQSPSYLAAWNDWAISKSDPPLTISGMKNVSLDARGRLIEFVAVPNQVIKKETEIQTPDWAKLFEEAGLDINKFEQAETQWTSPVFSDTQAAWKGTLADFADILIRIEAAAYQGKPVYFKVVAPWDKPDREVGTPDSISNKIFQIIVITTWVILIICPIFLIWRNLKVGRSDVKGGLKVAIFCLLGFFLQGLIAADHVSSLAGETSVFYQLLSFSLYTAILVALIYIALEPFARRWWSELLISWNRLLAGDFRDPIIGRDILLGGLFSIAAGLLFNLEGFLRENLFGAGEQISDDFFRRTLNGWSSVISQLFGDLAISVLVGLALLFLLLLFYFIFRNKKISIVLLFILIWIPQIIKTFQSGYWITGVIGGITVLFIIFMMIRFGLLAVIISVFYDSLGGSFPVTFNPSSFLFPGTVIVFAVILALTIYGFYTSTAGQPLFKNRFLDEAKE